MFIVRHRKIFYSVSIVLFVLSVVALLVWGLNLGVDFKGGSIVEVRYSTDSSVAFVKPEVAQINEMLKEVDIKGLSVREAGKDGFILRSELLDEVKHQALINALKIESVKLEEVRFNAIGPLMGKEAALKSLWAIFFVLLAIVLFVAYAFRKVSEPVSSWKYGLFAIVALIHDVTIPTGIFAILGHFKGVEVDTLFVTAILVVLGFSVHDTIVVYDRIRENLKLEYGHKGSSFDAIVGKSISQTYVRSINTSLTTLLSVVILYFIGPSSTQYFSLVLIIGITFGTYSSIFLASNLLVTMEKWQREKRMKN